MNGWNRKPYFEHYSKQVKCTYSMTVQIDITLLMQECKKRTIKLYPAMIYILATVVNQIEELRINYNEQNQLRIWNFCSPSYTIFHEDEKIFSTLWTEYNSRFLIFHENYLKDIKKYGNVKCFYAKGKKPSNTFPISCIPWVDFTAFNLNISDVDNYFFPIFTYGKYTQNDDKILLPIAAQVHHDVCDGYHAGLIFNAIKKLIANPKEWIDR